MENNDLTIQEARDADAFMQHDHWSRADIKVYQARALHACRQYAYAHSPFYQRFHKGLTKRSLQELPVLTKDLLMEHFDEVVTDRAIHLSEVQHFLAQMSAPTPFLGRYRVMSTSGSTGKPGVFLFSREEGEVVAASFSRFLLWAGLQLSTRIATIASTIPQHMSSSMTFVLQGQALPRIHLSASDPVESLVQRLNDWQPEGIAGYPSILLMLAEEQRQGLLHITPRFLFCASETLSPETRQHLVDLWHIQPFNIYAATESGVFAAECPSHQGLHLFEDLVIVEVVDHHNQPVPAGTFGARVLLTVLFRRLQPLIRYELSDSVCLSPQERCSCGRPFNLLTGVQGRTTDLLFFSTPAGEQVTVHPYIFSRILGNISAQGWQLLQQRDGLRLRLTGEPEASQEEDLLQRLRQVLAERGATIPPIWIEHVTTLPRNESGKVLPIVVEH